MASSLLGSTSSDGSVTSTNENTKVYFTSDDTATAANNNFLADVRVYMAGILIPVSSVTIHNNLGKQHTQAGFDMPPYPELFSIGERDRIPVQIFARESMVNSSQLILIFEGFIATRVYNNSTNARVVHYECVSYTSLIEDVRVNYMTKMDEALAAKAPGSDNKELHFYRTFLAPTLNMILMGLQEYKTWSKKDDEGNWIKYPSQYLQNVFDVMINAYSKVYGNDTAFAKHFSEISTKLKLLDRFTPLPYFDFKHTKGSSDQDTIEAREVDGTNEYTGNDKWKSNSCLFPILEGIQTAAALDYLAGTMRIHLSKKNNLFNVLLFLSDHMEYEFLALSSPAYHSKRYGTFPTKKDDKSDGNPEMVFYCLKPLLHDSPYVPGCNVIYRTQVLNIQSQVIFNKAPTRIQVQNLTGALATLTRDTVSALSQIGMADIYPDEKNLKKTEDHNNNQGDPEKPVEDDFFRKPTYNFIVDDLLHSEKYTGPWVQVVKAPIWYDFINKSYGATNSAGSALPDKEAKMMHERFLARQLLSSTYGFRTLSVTSVFDPYVTVGFPAVVFDNADTRLAFCGYVVSVVHNFTQQSATTTITMNYARILLEGATVEIPNPITMMNAITHHKFRMGEIYKQILGTPQIDTIPGAKAYSFEELFTKYMSVNSSVTNPQNSLAAAYASKRRNIATFEQYCSFMGLTYDKGHGPDGDVTPITIHGMFVEDRRLLPRYKDALTKQLHLTPAVTHIQQVFNTPEKDKMKIQSSSQEEIDEQTKKNKKIKELEKTASEQHQEILKLNKELEKATEKGDKKKIAELTKVIKDKCDERLKTVEEIEKLQKGSSNMTDAELAELQRNRNASVTEITYHRYIRDILIAISKRELARQSYR